MQTIVWNMSSSCHGQDEHFVCNKPVVGVLTKQELNCSEWNLLHAEAQAWMVVSFEVI